MAARKPLPAIALLGLLALATGRCDCAEPGGVPCTSDDDCPAGEVCVQGRCQSEPSDGGDAGGWDAGGLTRCDDQLDCQPGERCFNGYCVEPDPDPDCLVGEDDDCQDDRYCEPEEEGCLPWEAHPDPQPACEHIPPEGEFTPVEEWVWQNPAAAPEWDEVMMTPVVIDLSGQAAAEVFVVPAVLFNSFRADQGYSQDGVLRAVRGDSGEPIFSVTDPAYYTHPVSNIAAGDLDGDGLPEIVTGKSGGRDVICFEHDGSFKWQTQTDNLVVGWGGPALADVDADGVPEVVVGAAVIGADGAVRWSDNGSRGDNYRQDAGAPFSLPLDVDGDGRLEIVTGDTLYDYQGNVLWNTGYGDGFVAVADFSPGGPPEIVVVSRGAVRLQSAVSGEILWLRTAEFLKAEIPACDPDCGLLGPPTVADFDGDGAPEIGVAGAGVYLVLDTWGDVLWAVESRDASSNITGSAVFDFEGDRRAEVVYADEVSLKVYRGSDGTVLYQQAHSSLTACEYPVIADVDGDYNAEIVIAQNDLLADAPQPFKGVRVFGDAQDNWVTTRRIWNQHAYHVTNVNENGTIPTDPLENWQVEGLNNFRQNVQGDGLFDAPDLTARGLGFRDLGCPGGGVALFAHICNRGEQAVPPGVPVAFYRGDPRAGGALLGVTHTALVLIPRGCEVVGWVWPDPPVDQPVDIWVVADDEGGGAVPAGIHSECREANNIGTIPDVICRSET